MSRIVVVGGGMAAARLVELLVTPPTGPGTGHEITLLADEDWAPYNRILLSALLEGTHRLDALMLRPEDWWAEHGVDLRLGTRVGEIDRHAREVVLVDGARIGYDELVLATGAIPTLPPIRGLVRIDGTLAEAVHALRHLDDCLRLDAAVAALPAASPDDDRPDVKRAAVGGADGGRAVVVGGGLLGLQVARALAVRGLRVEVVEGGDHLLGRQVEAKAGAILTRDLRKLGTEVYLGARATRLVEPAPGEVHTTVRLDNGATLSTDLVVLTAGARPSTALARRAGLVCRRGVVVDDTLATSDPRIHAIGDCAQHGALSTGFVGPAWEQAEVLAARLSAHDPAPTYAGTRLVARLRATDLDVAVLGDPVAADRANDDGSRHGSRHESPHGGDVVEVTNPITGSHRRLVLREGRIVAATLVGDLSRIGLITQHFDRGTVLGPTEPGDLLLPERPTRAGSAGLPDTAEVCSCAGVSAGEIRACSSVEQARETTRATTGCGGCAPTVRQLLAARPTLEGVTP